MKQIPSPTDVMVVYGDFHGFTPEELFDYWVVPELVTQWWSNVAESDAREGGSYCFSWPEQGWRLRGTYDAFERGKRLKFGWNWDHEPDVHQHMRVDVHFMPIENGTRIGIYHSSYSESEADQGERQGHLEGWIHFGSRLAGLRVGEAE
jgi:uncharacterized protein YndB with AHSA1/START domain